MNGPTDWHARAMQEAMNRALWGIDADVLEAPRACSHAVAELVGDRCWGALLFDQSPLIRVYLDSVWRISALGVLDPGREVRELLEGWVAKAKEIEHPAFVYSVKGVNPVDFLAGLLSAAVGVYLAAYAETYADAVEAATQGLGHAVEPT